LAREPQPAALGFTLEQVDEDGAFVDGLADVYGHSRADVLRKATFGGAALLAGIGAAPALAASSRNDTRILNFDLVFEYMQSSFYVAAVQSGTVSRMAPPKRRWANVLGSHELAHVKILRSVLGRSAVAKPFFNFRGVTESEADFTSTAVAMEDLTVALLAGQAPHFDDRNLVAAAFSLLTTEARHAAWARRIAGQLPVVNAFDEPKSLAEVDQVVRSSRFIASQPRTRGRGRPRFTG
jgi:hypothetical protein